MGLFDRLAGEVRERPALRFSIAGTKLVCPHCGNETFWRSYAELVGDAAPLPGPIMGNHVSNIFVCESCTRIEWFLGNNVEAL